MVQSDLGPDRGATVVDRCTRCQAKAPALCDTYWGETLCGHCTAMSEAEFDVEGWPKAAWDWPPSKSIITVGRLWFDTPAPEAQGALWYRDDGDPVFEPVRTPTAAGLVQMALRRGKHQVWLHRTALEGMGLPAALDPRQPVTDSPWLEGANLAHLDQWMRVRAGSRVVNIAVPSWETRRRLGQRALWDQPPDAGLLHAELSAFEASVGHLWIHSGAVTSDAMLREHWRGRIQRAVVPTGLLASAGLEDTAHWTLPEGNPRGKWCYAFDLNGMFLGAASGLALPVGAPAPAIGPPWLGEQMTMPGYWLLADRGWVTTPSLRPGDVPEQAHIYPGHHQYLQPWYKTLRDARAALCPGSTALAAVKAVYTQGIGRLGSARRSDDKDPLWQPYWRQAVIAQARERFNRRLEQLRPAAGTVVAVDTDAVFITSDREDARILAVQLGLPLGPGLGQFKVLGRCKATAARQILYGGGVPAGSTIIGELRKAVGGGG